METMLIAVSIVAWLAGIPVGAWLAKMRLAEELAEKDRKISNLELVLRFCGKDRC